METAIYNLSIEGTHRGRVYLSMLPNSSPLLDIVYPDDERMTINARTPRELVLQFREVTRRKFGNEHVTLEPASPAEVEDYLNNFRQHRDAFLKELLSGN